MKHNTAVFFRFLAIIVVIFLGITAILPQISVKDDDTVFPAWEDVDINTDTDITEAFKRGIIIGGKNGEYGKNEPLTAAETSYAAVRMKEDKDGLDYSFKYFNSEDGEKYIKKAKKYKLWSDLMPDADTAVSREEFTAVLSRIGESGEKVNDGSGIGFGADYTYKDEIKKMYEYGIMLDTNITDAFSPEIQITRADASRLVMIYLNPERRIKIVLPDYEALKTHLSEKMSGWQGDWSLYYEDCKTGHQISINSHRVYSASLIKLFVAQTAYDSVSKGELLLTSQLEDEIRKMITYSDNEAWKYIARKLGGGTYSRGMALTTEVAQASGFSDTGQFYQGSHKNYNFTSVNDCGAYLRGILNATIVNKEYSQKILLLLKQQQHLQKIPSGVPESVATANKTGELDYMQGDAAIVYAPNGTYILVIIGDSLDNGYGQISKFTELSKIVYKYTNQ